ncbi:hypothetical protein BKA56DRAFT_612498 [Ilyonectria sp. MPI-CAGE-AT-0026]|nr:hypothetical protein BKA56DRAFT_612498 [Ilyonectria sp. MPI-CAGE-AT-0026]
MDNLNVRDNEAGDAMLQPRSHERRCDPTWSNAAGVSDGHSHQKAQVRDISIGIGAGDSSKAGDHGVTAEDLMHMKPNVSTPWNRSFDSALAPEGQDQGFAAGQMPNCFWHPWTWKLLRVETSGQGSETCSAPPQPPPLPPPPPAIITTHHARVPKTLLSPCVQFMYMHRYRAPSTSIGSPWPTQA